MIEKVTRDAFLYMPPRASADDLCGTCALFIEPKERCFIHRADDQIDDDDSCGFYVPGTPMEDGKPIGAVTPLISGLVEGPVQCRNCRFAADAANTCGLYRSLNKSAPSLFDLDEKIEPPACCNAFKPEGDADDDEKAAPHSIMYPEMAA